MVMVTVALIMAVVVTNIYAKKESPQHAPDWCVKIVARFYPAYLTPAAAAARKPEVVVVESGNGTVPPPKQAGDDATGSENRRDRRSVELEWKLVAKFVDRVFFWIFLVLSVVVHVILFFLMVPKSAKK